MSRAGRAASFNSSGDPTKVAATSDQQGRTLMRLILCGAAALLAACTPANEGERADTTADTLSGDAPGSTAERGTPGGAAGGAGSIDACVSAVLAERPGEVRKLELKDERGTPTFEFDVHARDGNVWDIECDQNTGRVTEIEQDVGNANHPLFSKQRKVSEADARKTALAAHAGKVKAVDYEVQQDGSPAYEFDIVMSDGKEMKVEVGAATGEILEANLERWQIGLEESPRGR